MTKTPTRPGPGPAPRPAPAGKPAKSARERPQETWRDFVEQIVVAVLLAILIRGFNAEAFVIPTGSMAPTLKGRHKEVTCPQCRDVFTINASEETEAYLNSTPGARAAEAAVCGNCRFASATGDEPSFKGDRILVMKFPYELPFLPGSGGPQRWDVVVFHYPEKPEQNYIKRLVGLPGEELRIYRGNLFVRPNGSDEAFQVARKPLSRLKAMAMLVNDDRHRATLLKDRPEWLRWKGDGFEEEVGKEGVFTSKGDRKVPTVLTYRHVVPDPEQWNEIAARRPLSRPARASLITDFYSYNGSTTAMPYDPLAAWRQSDWVGDLLLDFDLRVDKAEGTARVELVEAGVRNRCELDLATGKATLYHGEAKLGEAPTRVAGPGRYAITFANVDDRLTLTVDGRAPFGDGLAYDDGPDAPALPTSADLEPARIVADGAPVAVSGLVLRRDIYYTQDPRYPDCQIHPPPAPFEAAASRGLAEVVHMFDVLSDPAKFAPLMAGSQPGQSYPIRPGHYMMMGDNSPRSSDGRAWGRLDRDWDDERARWEVPRSLLIGRAFFVYWPHGIPLWPKIELFPGIRIPFRPYFERMLPIR